jgi:hypothetical protein
MCVFLMENKCSTESRLSPRTFPPGPMENRWARIQRRAERRQPAQETRRRTAAAAPRVRAGWRLNGIPGHRSGSENRELLCTEQRAFSQNRQFLHGVQAIFAPFRAPLRGPGWTLPELPKVGANTASAPRKAAGWTLPELPKVGAVCGKAARTALCGGRSAMSVPTAIRLLSSP